MSPAASDLRKLLAAHPFLNGLTAHQLGILGDCAAHAHFAANEVLFRAGDPAKGFFLLETGHVAIEAADSEGRPLTIDTVAAGEPLGWSWIFEPFVCEYGARATEPTMAIFIDALCLAEHRGADLTLGHELFKRMSQTMVRRLSAARRKLVAAAARREP